MYTYGKTFRLNEIQCTTAIHTQYYNVYTIKLNGGRSCYNRRRRYTGYTAAVLQDTYVMPDLRFLIDFHWAISWLDGGSPSSCRCCSDDRSASANLGRGDGAAIGSNCMQKLSSASSESTAVADDGSSSTSAGSASSPAAEADAAAATPPPLPNVRSSDKTNRLEFLRCWSIVRPVSHAIGGGFARARYEFAAKRVFSRGLQIRGRGQIRRRASMVIS